MMRTYFKRMSIFILAFVISFISIVSFCDVPEAHATTVDLYSTEQIIATLMYSLGISVQDYDTWTDGSSALQPDFTSDRYQVIQGGGGSDQEDPDEDPKPAKYYFIPSKKDSDAFLQQLYAAEAARKPDIEAMIESAKKTGKIVIDKASGLWEYLKENVGKVVTSLKKPDNGSDAMADYYDLSSLYSPYPYTEFYNYIGAVVKDMYAKVGVSTPVNALTDVNSRYFGCSYDKYYLLFTTYYVSDGVAQYGVHGMQFDDYQSFISKPKWLTTNMPAVDSCAFFDSSVWDFYTSLDGAYSNYNVYRYGKVVDVRLLNMSEAHLLQQSYTPAIDAKDNYDRVYVPEPGHATEIITPDTQVEQNPDGSYSVTGDYVIDMKNPVTYPVDLTDGVTLDDKKTPVAEILPKQDPSTDPDPEPDPDPDPDPEPEPEPESLWERLFKWLSKIYDALIQLPQILTSNGLVLGNIVSSMSTISLAVHAIQTAAEGLLSGFDGLEIPDYADLIRELPAQFADAIEFPEINFPEIPNYMDILKQMLELLKNLLKLGNIETLLQSMFVFDTAAIALALDELLDVWNFDFLKDLRDKFGSFVFSDECIYPKIKIARPKIFAPYYKDDYIVLCDFADYKNQLFWCRNIIRMMIWIYFIYSIFRHFKVRLSLS